MINDMTFSYSMITELERDIFKVKEKIKEGQQFVQASEECSNIFFLLPQQQPHKWVTPEEPVQDNEA